MNSTKFFTNRGKNTLFDKFKGIISGMHGLHSFHAVVGYFRSSGYFRIRSEMKNISKIQILVGINIDNIFRNHDKSKMFLNNDNVNAEAFEIYCHDFIKDVQEAAYSKEVVDGIVQLRNDMNTGRVELRIHPTKDLHAKVYLFLPEQYTEHSDGWVIMGSSNLSNSGLGLTQPPRYELNVSMKDYPDVKFCKDEFDSLWAEGTPLTPGDIEEFTKRTYIGQITTPYELYMKVLIDFFKGRVEDEFTIELPSKFMRLKYQEDAVIQGYQMLLLHNGFFLADVVGLGKTVVAAMVTKRFIEANGIRDTKILVVYPPVLEDNWRTTFREFNIDKNTHFVSCGSLDKVIDMKNNYFGVEEYDMILVDEAHRFRADTSDMYDYLQRICKADRAVEGRIGGKKKKVILISATPLNNRPNDIYNLIQLFQDKRRSTIDGIPNLQDYFAPKMAEYKFIMSNGRDRDTYVKEVDDMYEKIRKDVIDKVTVRRTRGNIERNEDYSRDITFKFPEIEKPRKINYVLPDKLKILFEETMVMLTKGLKYARYKAIENLIYEHKAKYPNADIISDSLAGIYRTFMVKRLESSFEAFRKSLNNLRRATQGMVDMFNEDKVIIAPDLKIKTLQDKGKTLEEIIEIGIKRLELERTDFVYSANDFNDGFVDDLKLDIMRLDELIVEWAKVTSDPKLDMFINYINNNIFDPIENPTGKLVVFSESKDTIKYLERELKQRLSRRDILSVSSADRRIHSERIMANFDANYSGEKSDEYNIVIATDVLSEGVNLHRANVIVNYDTPWNASKLMQRIGRVNRIGSVAEKIINYMFYPSSEGDKQIKLYDNALKKLQGFHSAYGEDSQIYSQEEIVKQFELFDTNIPDHTDKDIKLMREVREFRNNNPEDYERIKSLPFKSRTGRDIREASKKNMATNTSLVYISSTYKSEFYKVENNHATAIDFLEAVELFKALPEEKAKKIGDIHYEHVKMAQKNFNAEVEKIIGNDMPTASNRDSKTDAAKKLLREMGRESADIKTKDNCKALSKYIELGTYTRLTRELQRLELKKRNNRIEHREIEKQLNVFVAKYCKTDIGKIIKVDDDRENIVLSETFI